MDIKKYLQQKAEEDVSSVLSEEEKEYCKSIALESEFQKGRRRLDRRFWVPFSCAMCVLLAAVIAIVIIFAPRKPPIRYFDDKIVFRTSGIEELNGDTKYFNLTQLENTLYDFSLSYDSDSGDKLYYEVNAKGFIENSHLVIVVNKNYEYPFDSEGNEIVKKNLNDYTLNYYLISGGDQIQYNGWINLKTETTYITYTNIASQSPDDEAFFTYVQSVIQAK